MSASEIPTQAQVLAWVEDRWPNTVDPICRALKLGEEAGEVCGAVIKQAQGIRTSSDVRQETAQVVMAALGLAESVGFDLWEAVADEWAEMATRTWAPR